MKKTLILIVIILLSQLVIPIFEVQLLIYCLCGFLFSFKFPVKRLFLKSFLIEFAISIFFIFLYADNIKTFRPTIELLGVSGQYSGLLLNSLIVLINSLTVAFTFQIGNSIHKLVK